MNQKQEYLEFTNQTYRWAVDLIPMLNMIDRLSWQISMVLLYCTMTEHLRSACVLFQNKAETSIPVLLRSFVEAYVDFINLSIDPNYEHSVRSSELKEWGKITSKAIVGGNEFLEGLILNSENDTTNVEIHEEFADLKSNGHKPQTWLEKFEKAGLQNVYESIYNEISCESHNNMRALKSRHLFQNEDGRLQLRLYGVPDDNVSVFYANAFCYFIIEATLVIHAVFNTGCSDVIAVKKEELNEIREKVKKVPPPSPFETP